MVLSKILFWIKKHIWQSSLIGFGFFMLPLIIVHLLYKWRTPFFLFQSSWDSGDLITYISGFEAFIGTLFLGFIAVWQNEKAIKINDRILKIEEIDSHFHRYPNYRIGKCSVEQTSLNKIFDLNAIMFHSKELKQDFIFSTEKTSKQFHRFSFIIENISDFNCTISMNELVLTSLTNNAFKIEYDNTAIAKIDTYFTFASKQELQMSFILYNEDLHEEDSFLVDTRLTIMNYLEEEFSLSLKFILRFTEKNIIFAILSDKMTSK